METIWKVLSALVALFFLQLCNGLPLDLERTYTDGHIQFLTGLIAVLLTICGVVCLAGCLCCQRRNGFKEFRDSPVVASVASNLDHGHVNPIGNGEFTIFTPLSPPHQNNNVFLANQQVITRAEDDFRSGDIDVSSWFDANEKDFPRAKLKYIRELGKGWFGRVVEGTAQGLCADESEWTPVVVRILEASASSRQRVLFLHDASIYRCPPHHNLLKLFGRSLDTVPLLLLQEYCSQGDIKKYLKQQIATKDKFLSSDLPLLWCYQLASAVKHLHENNITHPDLATRNCQLALDLSLKLGDYGSGVSDYPEDYYHGPENVPVRWCAPECVTCTVTTIQPKKVTKEGNIWSLGVCLWEIYECGAQPYEQMGDDEVVSQVLGPPNIKLAKPTKSVLYTDYIFRLMQLCWVTSESRPSISKIDLMLADLMQVQQHTKNASEAPVSIQDFDRRWENLKPNNLTINAEIHDNITILNMQLDNDQPKSASLNNLLLEKGDGDKWLDDTVEGIDDSLFVHDLDHTIASSPKPKIQFKLGPMDNTNKPRNELDLVQNDSITDSMLFVQRASSESETEDEHWKRKIECGAYSEKVRQKSRSVADLMVLTHIDNSESDSETPSYDSRMNYFKNVRCAPANNNKLEIVSTTFGSEGNLLSIHNTFEEELKKLQEERRDSLLFVPDFDSHTLINQFIPGVSGMDESLINDLNSPATLEPKNQIFNVYNVVTISPKYSPVHTTNLKHIINFNEDDNLYLPKREIPKLSEIIENNNELMDYIIAKYDSDPNENESITPALNNNQINANQTICIEKLNETIIDNKMHESNNKLIAIDEFILMNGIGIEKVPISACNDKMGAILLEETQKEIEKVSENANETIIIAKNVEKQLHNQSLEEYQLIVEANAGNLLENANETILIENNVDKQLHNQSLEENKLIVGSNAGKLLENANDIILIGSNMDKQLQNQSFVANQLIGEANTEKLLENTYKTTIVAKNGGKQTQNQSAEENKLIGEAYVEKLFENENEIIIENNVEKLLQNQSFVANQLMGETNTEKLIENANRTISIAKNGEKQTQNQSIEENQLIVKANAEKLSENANETIIIAKNGEKQLKNQYFEANQLIDEVNVENFSESANETIIVANNVEKQTQNQSLDEYKLIAESIVEKLLENANEQIIIDNNVEKQLKNQTFIANQLIGAANAKKLPENTNQTIIIENNVDKQLKNQSFVANQLNVKANTEKLQENANETIIIAKNMEKQTQNNSLNEYKLVAESIVEKLLENANETIIIKNNVEKQLKNQTFIANQLFGEANAKKLPENANQTIIIENNVDKQLKNQSFVANQLIGESNTEKLEENAKNGEKQTQNQSSDEYKLIAKSIVEKILVNANETIIMENNVEKLLKNQTFEANQLIGEANVKKLPENANETIIIAKNVEKPTQNQSLDEYKLIAKSIIEKLLVNANETIIIENNVEKLLKNQTFEANQLIGEANVTKLSENANESINIENNAENPLKNQTFEANQLIGEDNVKKISKNVNETILIKNSVEKELKNQTFDANQLIVEADTHLNITNNLINDISHELIVKTQDFINNEIITYEDSNKTQVEFDISNDQEEISPSSLTHSVFTSTPFIKRSLQDTSVILGASDDFSIDFYSGLKTDDNQTNDEVLTFSSNFILGENPSRVVQKLFDSSPNENDLSDIKNGLNEDLNDQKTNGINKKSDKMDMKYSLETWDNFLGQSFDDQHEFDLFGPERASLLFIENQNEAIDKTIPTFKITSVVNENYSPENEKEQSDGTFNVDFTKPTIVEDVNGTFIKNEANATFNIDDGLPIALNGTFEVINGTFVKENNTTVDLNDINLEMESDESNKTYNKEEYVNEGSWENEGGSGWFLHPQTNGNDPSGEMDLSQDDSYVGFSMDDDVMAAIRNELLTKLPQAQRASSEQVDEGDEYETTDKNEVFIRYNVYNPPLSPILEESESLSEFFNSGQSTPHCTINTDLGDSDSDWSEPGMGPNSLIDDDTLSPRLLESPLKSTTHQRHTPSQDSCCSNDTLFNLEEIINCEKSEDTHKIDECLNKTLNSTFIKHIDNESEVVNIDQISSKINDSTQVNIDINITPVSNPDNNADIVINDNDFTSLPSSVDSITVIPKLDDKIALPDLLENIPKIIINTVQEFIEKEQNASMAPKNIIQSTPTKKEPEESSSSSETYLTASDTCLTLQNVAPLNSPEDRPWKHIEASLTKCEVIPEKVIESSDVVQIVYGFVNENSDTENLQSNHLSPEAISLDKLPKDIEINSINNCKYINGEAIQKDCGQTYVNISVSEEDKENNLYENIDGLILYEANCEEKKIEVTRNVYENINRSPDECLYENIDAINADEDKNNYENIEIIKENEKNMEVTDVYEDINPYGKLTNIALMNLKNAQVYDDVEPEMDNTSKSVDYVELVPEYSNTNYDNINYAEYIDLVNTEAEVEYDNVNDHSRGSVEEVYGPLTDIRFSGPSDSQMMTTSFSDSNDLGDDQDWDSGSDTRSSSSGEFIWKEGEHEASVKALHAAPHDLQSEELQPMEEITEEDSSTSSSEEGDGPEFVPSAWDKFATPTKSALRSPEKTLDRSNRKARGVSFKKQKYHCIYEYPREPETPVIQTYDLWKPEPDYATLTDWEIDIDPYMPGTSETEINDSTSSTSHIHNNRQHRNNLYQITNVPDFIGSTILDDDFYISSSAKPFDAFGGSASSQFFPGKHCDWSELIKNHENVTPDSGVEDITPGSLSDSDYIRPSRQILPLKILAQVAANKNPQMKHTEIGGLRHTLNKLKLDLPPSPSAFTNLKTFNVEIDPIISRHVPTFTTFGKSRFVVQQVDTPDDNQLNAQNVSFEALPYKPMSTKHVFKDDFNLDKDKNRVEVVRGEASLLDSADEDSGIESCTLERKQTSAEEVFE